MGGGVSSTCIVKVAIGVAPLNGHLAGQDLVGQDAERVDVGAVIVRGTDEPFGRDVLGRAGDVVFAGQAPEQPRDAEVDDLDCVVPAATRQAT